MFTAPTGYVCVLKNLSIVWGDITASGLDAWFQTGDLTKLARYTWAVSGGDITNYGGTAQWWGAWVLEPGETLAIQTASGTCDFTAAGYQLATP